MKAFVTGGGGFLGKAIVKALIEKNYEVISYSRSSYPELEKIGAKHKQGDLKDYQKLNDAIKGSDIVFHVAAKAGYWGDYYDFYNANVVGTENIIKACKESGIKKLVFTSSPSVVHSGEAIEGADESLAYPKHFESFYPQTKAMAEKIVLEANSENFSTVALRPHLIWGPGDTQFLPRFVERAKSGSLKLVGNGKNLVDTVYIDNAVSAHILAAEKLSPESPIAGKAYFITQGEPIPVADFINNMLKAAGIKPVTSSIPFPVALAIGQAFEFIYKTFKIKGEPRMTAFLARQLATPHWFDISAAKNELGYNPEISIAEGVRRLESWIKEGNAKELINI